MFLKKKKKNSFVAAICNLSFMKAAFRNIIFLMVIWTYIFGSSGFTVHHCCCNKHFHTTCAIFNAYNPYVFEDCHMLEDSIDNIVKIRKPKHCSNFVYSLDGEKYSNNNVLKAPICWLVELITLLSEPNLSISDSNSLANALYYCGITHYKYRPWCTPDNLCTFKI